MRNKDKRLLIFDVEIEVDWDYGSDQAPNPMDEREMLQHRIQMALREQFPDVQYDLTINPCDC